MTAPRTPFTPSDLSDGATRGDGGLPATVHRLFTDPGNRYRNGDDITPLALSVPTGHTPPPAQENR
ncbi:hypothetical protein [Streptomyces sp. NBC_00687]|uniref:hypothetical protein n=1 Tax=Streptomyces sp. NBC_00687 TaxID=2975807 RepID=UPI002254EC53|nr:hypothetical protein [Streptomyces sp. NBC_00687]MCX4919553.1 hypothetical protein [Streptomyces sp. NBC_00687]